MPNTELLPVSPIISHLGATVTINGQPFVNGETTLDLTQPLKVKVTSADGTLKDYTIYSGYSTGTANGLPTVGGFVAGLTGTVVLQNNGGDNKSLNTNGSFSFNTNISLGATYIVTVLTNPVNQFCNITNGTGTATGTVTTIIVDCNNTPGTTVQSFTDLGNQTIRDNNTGLIWMKCTMSNSPGVPRSGSDCLTGTFGIYRYCREDDNDCNGGTNTGAYGTLITTGFSGTHQGSFGTVYNASAGTDHYTAYKACNDANTTPSGGFTGKTNWRVPTKDELVSLVDYSKTSAPVINITYFTPNTLAGSYWSSTSYAAGTTGAWGVSFVNGTVSVTAKSTNVYVRCVSGP
jgi:hypothetical protein